MVIVQPAATHAAAPASEPSISLTLVKAVDGKDLELLLQPEGTAIVAGMGDAQDWNHASHLVDASGLRLHGGMLRGIVKVRLVPDATKPKDGKPVDCEFTLGVKLARDTAAGTYTGKVGPAECKGSVAGRRIPSYTGGAGEIELRLENAADSDKEWKRVVEAVIQNESDRQSAIVSTEIYRRCSVLLTGTDNDVRVEGNKISGGFGVVVPAEGDRPQQKYTYRLEGTVIGSTCGGLLVTTLNGKEMKGFFHGSLYPKPRIVKQYVYKKTPQVELQALVTLPPGWKKTDKRPVLVFFSGGGWRMGSLNQVFRHSYYFAERGMVVVRADYRIIPEGVTVGETQADTRSAVRWVRSHAGELGIDPAKVVTWGQSAGGQLAVAAALVDGKDDPGEDAAVSSVPDAIVLISPVLKFDPEDFKTEKDKKEFAGLCNPYASLKGKIPPTLIIIGSVDHLLDGCAVFARRATELGSRVDFYVEPEGEHTFALFATGINKTCLCMDLFLESLGYLKGRPTAVVVGEPMKAYPYRNPPTKPATSRPGRAG
jgi:acetyl esterase/lipase